MYRKKILKIGIVAVLVLAMVVCVGAASAFTVTFDAGGEVEV